MLRIQATPVVYLFMLESLFLMRKLSEIKQVEKLSQRMTTFATRAIFYARIFLEE